MDLLERQTELRQLAESLADANAGRGRLVSVSGEAGIGKTALVQAFIASSSRQARVLLGRCEDLSTPEPLGPIRDIVRSGGWPERAWFDDGTPRLALFSALLDRLSEAATLVVIEDLHWADDATLDFVRFLGRRLGDLPILV